MPRTLDTDSTNSVASSVFMFIETSSKVKARLAAPVIPILSILALMPFLGESASLNEDPDPDSSASSSSAALGSSALFFFFLSVFILVLQSSFCLLFSISYFFRFFCFIVFCCLSSTVSSLVIPAAAVNIWTPAVLEIVFQK